MRLVYAIVPQVEAAHLKRLETSLAEEEAKLDIEKALFVKEIKRRMNEEASRFNHLPMLHGNRQGWCTARTGAKVEGPERRRR